MSVPAARRSTEHKYFDISHMKGATCEVPRRYFLSMLIMKNNKGVKEMRKSLKTVMAILLCCMMALSLFACGTSNTSAESPAASSESGQGSGSGTEVIPEAPTGDENITVRIGISGGVLGDLTMGGYPQECFPAVDTIFDVVFYADPDTREWTSNILEDWYWEDDTSFVLTLRDDIVFSNGDTAKAEDLLYSYTSHAVNGNEHWIADMKILVDESYVRDEYTAVVVVSEKSEQFFNRNIVLLNKQWAEATNWEPEEWYFPVGSGPYYVAEHSPDEQIIVRLKDEYWQRPVEDYYVNEYIFTRYGDAATAYMALEIGDIDMCATDGNTYDTLLNDGAALGLDAAVIKSGVNMIFMMPQQMYPPWQNESVRRAVAIGVNWAELGELMFGSLAIPATSFTPSDGPLYLNVGTYEYDPDRAVELLSEAGYGPGDLTIRMCTSESAENKAFGEGLTYYLGEIGINMDVTYADFTTAAAVNASIDGVDCGLQWNRSGSATRNPATAIHIIDGSSVPYGLIDDERILDLYDQLKTGYDLPVDVRKPIADELQRLIYDEVLLIPFVERAQAIGFNANVFTRQIVTESCDGSMQFLRTSRLGLRSNWE